MSDSVARWTIASLRNLVPGSRRAPWLRNLVPELIAQGALVKKGKAWLGRQLDIEAALLGKFQVHDGNRRAHATRRRL